jgi:hypothetical protein
LLEQVAQNECPNETHLSAEHLEEPKRMAEEVNLRIDITSETPTSHWNIQYQMIVVVTLIFVMKSPRHMKKIILNSMTCSSLKKRKQPMRRLVERIVTVEVSNAPTAAQLKLINIELPKNIQIRNYAQQVHPRGTTQNGLPQHLQNQHR